MTTEEAAPTTKFCTGCGLEQPDHNEECQACGLTAFSGSDPRAEVEEEPAADDPAAEEEAPPAEDEPGEPPAVTGNTVSGPSFEAGSGVDVTDREGGDEEE